MKKETLTERLSEEILDSSKIRQAMYNEVEESSET